MFPPRRPDTLQQMGAMQGGYCDTSMLLPVYLPRLCSKQRPAGAKCSIYKRVFVRGMRTLPEYGVHEA